MTQPAHLVVDDERKLSDLQAQDLPPTQSLEEPLPTGTSCVDILINGNLYTFSVEKRGDNGGKLWELHPATGGYRLCFGGFTGSTYGSLLADLFRYTTVGAHGTKISAVFNYLNPKELTITND